jgi:hypothetical protein
VSFTDGRTRLKHERKSLPINNLAGEVKTDLGSTWRRHVDQIKPSKIAEDIAQNTPLIEEPRVETTENTKTDVQTDNINDKPIDGPSTITAVQERRYILF